VRVTAGGFAPRSEVTLFFATESGGQQRLDVVTADAAGRFDTTLKIPRDARRGVGQVIAVGVRADGEALFRAWLVEVLGPRA
jgi:hypothetical protein